MNAAHAYWASVVNVDFAAGLVLLGKTFVAIFVSNWHFSMSLRSYRCAKKMEEKTFNLLLLNSIAVNAIYLLSSAPLHMCGPAAPKPQTHRSPRLLLIKSPQPLRRCESRIKCKICLLDASFNCAVSPTPESQPLECMDGTDVSKLFIFLFVCLFVCRWWLNKCEYSHSDPKKIACIFGSWVCVRAGNMPEKNQKKKQNENQTSKNHSLNQTESMKRPMQKSWCTKIFQKNKTTIAILTFWKTS